MHKLVGNLLRAKGKIPSEVKHDYFENEYVSKAKCAVIQSPIIFINTANQEKVLTAKIDEARKWNSSDLEDIKPK